jgi:hypothetical protein
LTTRGMTSFDMKLVVSLIHQAIQLATAISQSMANENRTNISHQFSSAETMDCITKNSALLQDYQRVLTGVRNATCSLVEL